MLKKACGYDPARMKSLKLRFTSPVFPGETIRTDMWIDGKEMVGEVVEKRRAREIYESYKRKNVDPGLLEQVRVRHPQPHGPCAADLGSQLGSVQRRQGLVDIPCIRVRTGGAAYAPWVVISAAPPLRRCACTMRLTRLMPSRSRLA